MTNVDIRIEIRDPQYVIVLQRSFMDTTIKFNGKKSSTCSYNSFLILRLCIFVAEQ